MELPGHVLERNCLIVGLDVVEHRDQPVVLLRRAVLQLRELIDRYDQSVDRSVNDILVDAYAPVCFAIAQDADIGHSLGGRASGKRMLLVSGELIADPVILLDGIADRVQTAVSVRVHDSPVVSGRDRRLCHNAVCLAEMALRDRKVRRVVHISVCEDLVNSLRRKLAVSLVRNLLHGVTDFLSHLLRQHDRVVLPQHICYAALSGLAVDADDV